MHIQITENQRENLEGNQRGKKSYLQREHVEFSQIMSNLLDMQYRKLSLLNKELELQLKWLAIKLWGHLDILQFKSSNVE